MTAAPQMDAAMAIVLVSMELPLPLAALEEVPPSAATLGLMEAEEEGLVWNKSGEGVAEREAVAGDRVGDAGGALEADTLEVADTAGVDDGVSVTESEGVAEDPVPDAPVPDPPGCAGNDPARYPEPLVLPTRPQEPAADDPVVDPFRTCTPPEPEPAPPPPGATGM